MKTYKKFSALLLLVTLFGGSLSAIGFGYNIFEVRATPEFAAGILPVSIRYEFKFPVPDILAGNNTVFSIEFDNGLEYRELGQNPDTGEYYENNRAESWYFEDRDYTVHYDEFKLKFEQGILGETASGEDHLKFHLSLGGRFEMGFERLLFMYDPTELSGVFWKDARSERFPGSTWIGQPELAGKRNVLQTFVNFGFTVDWLDNFPTEKNGIRYSAMLRYSPEKMPAGDGTSDFVLLDNYISLAYTPLCIHQKAKPELTWFSLVFGNDFNYRFVYGTKVPYYAGVEHIYGMHLPATEHMVSNRTYLSLYGPQIYAKDLYPAFELFYDVAWYGGRPVNSLSRNLISGFASSFGCRAEFIVYNIFSVYYEIGFSVKKPFEDPSFSSFGGKFGVTVEV